MEEVGSSLLLAVLGVESLHGEADVQLNAVHYLDSEQRMCLVDAGSEVGRNLNKLLAGFLRREFGSHQFTVRRIKGPIPFRAQKCHHAG